MSVRILLAFCFLLVYCFALPLALKLEADNTVSHLCGNLCSNSSLLYNHNEWEFLPEVNTYQLLFCQPITNSASY
jgi:hypothetical protein